MTIWIFWNDVLVVELIHQKFRQVKSSVVIYIIDILSLVIRETSQD